MNTVKHNHHILILVKTYPSPSRKYIETCCTAGIDDQGNMIRIYPVPFRLLQEEKQYKKWQWVEGDTMESKADKRPESRKIDYTAMKALDLRIQDWPEKIKWLNKCPRFGSVTEIDEARMKTGLSLGIIKPTSILDLEFQSEEPDWTPDQLEKLTQQLTQDDLFTEVSAAAEIKQLEKIPYGFYYHFTCPGSDKPERIRITDWEIYQLYRNVCGAPNWQKKMREMYVEKYGAKDVYLILGNHHRFQNQWLCIGVVAAPKGTQAPATLDLF